MYETLDAVINSALKHDVGAQDIRCGELEGVAETQVDVRLRGKMEDDVDVILFQTSHDLRLVRYVAVAK